MGIAYKPSEYTAIEWWHKSSGSQDYYIKNLQKRALAEKVDDSAVYWNPEKDRWILLKDLPPSLQERCKVWVSKYSSTVGGKK